MHNLFKHADLVKKIISTLFLCIILAAGFTPCSALLQYYARS